MIKVYHKIPDSGEGDGTFNLTADNKISPTMVGYFWGYYNKLPYKFEVIGVRFIFLLHKEKVNIPKKKVNVIPFFIMHTPRALEQLVIVKPRQQNCYTDRMSTTSLKNFPTAQEQEANPPTHSWTASISTWCTLNSGAHGTKPDHQYNDVFKSVISPGIHSTQCNPRYAQTQTSQQGGDNNAHHDMAHHGVGRPETGGGHITRPKD